MKSYLGKEYDNLITVDFVCHGVCSPKYFDMHIEELNQVSKSCVEKYEFRVRKKHFWGSNSRYAKITFKNKKEKIVSMDNDSFLMLYYNHLGLRPCCITCKLAQPHRCSDITIADAWGINKLYKTLNAHNGISEIIFNTSKSLNLSEEILSRTTSIPVDVEWIIQHNGAFRKPTWLNKRNNIFIMSVQNGNNLKESVNAALKKPLVIKICKKIYLALKSR